MCRYKSTDLGQLNLDLDSFQENLLLVIHSRYSRRLTYHSLYKFPSRVYTVPPYSSAIEWVFSIVNKIVTPNWVRLTRKYLSSIVVALSLLPYKTCKGEVFTLSLCQLQMSQCESVRMWIVVVQFPLQSNNTSAFWVELEPRSHRLVRNSIKRITKTNFRLQKMVI